MTNRQNRMDTLSAAGVNTTKYFQFKLSEGLKEGSQITLVIEDGHPVVKGDNGQKVTDPILNNIYKDGYIQNPRLFRRWVMAQMFRMMGERYKTFNGVDDYAENLANMSYYYQFSFIERECNVLAHLEKEDRREFVIRSSFFNKDVFIDTYTQYINDLMREIKIHGYAESWKIEQIDNCVGEIYNLINQITTSNYAGCYRAIKEFNKCGLIKWVDDKCKKCTSWINAYKGNGAYYTLQNMVRFHQVFIEDENTGYKFRNKEAEKYLNNHLVEYTGEGWRYLAMLRKVIVDNRYNFSEDMCLRNR